MAYTHDFEFKLDGIVIEGEINFNHGEDAAFKSTAGEEMTIKQHSQIQALFEALVAFHMKGADIEKINITRRT